jgi:hypothetical protein
MPDAAPVTTNVRERARSVLTMSGSFVIGLPQQC